MDDLFTKYFDRYQAFKDRPVHTDEQLTLFDMSALPSDTPIYNAMCLRYGIKQRPTSAWSDMLDAVRRARSDAMLRREIVLISSQIVKPGNAIVMSGV